ncbi:ATP-binding cassette domain-containing protein [Streptococcus ruminantium]|uniref:ATP-binding cassette domain-containing protein n=1 Tax=Streptococcus ruminantium TaxID=1917441 RepID=UPI0012DF3BAB|nr:ABC transporter ATP-binding protein [Streptococcus ruminantium]
MMPNKNKIVEILSNDKLNLSLSAFLTFIVSVGAVYTVYARTDILNEVLAGTGQVWFNLIWLVVCLVVVEILRAILKIVNAKLTRKWKLYLGNRISKNIERMPFEKFYQKEIGDHMAIYTYQLEVVSVYLLEPITDFASSVVLSVVSLVFLGLISWKFVVFALISTVLLFSISGKFGKKINNGYAALSARTGEFSEKLKEYLSAYEILKNLGVTNRLSEQIEQSQEAKENQQFLITKYLAFGGLTLQSVEKLFEMLIFAFTIFLISRGELLIGAIVSVPAMLGIFLQAVEQLVDLYMKIIGTKDMLDTVTEISETVEEDYPTVERYIEFENVGFTYGPKQIFNQLNFRFDTGRKYALVGKSGSGKSTLLKLLLGRLKPTEGHILIDEKVYSPEVDVNFSNQIGYINQSLFIFSDSIRYNIGLGQSYTDEQLWEVLEKVKMADVVAKLPQGLDEVVGKFGVDLSGGEQQRLAMARILIRKHPILLLDEATSAIDVKTSKVIEQEILSNPDLTVIMITHHLQEEIKPFLTDILDLDN